MITIISMTNYNHYLTRQLKNSKFKKAFDDETLRLKIAYRILELRHARKLTQKELAKKIGTTQSVVARIEQGYENITVDRLDAIAHILGTHVRVEFV